MQNTFDKVIGNSVARHEAKPARPESQPARPEAQPARSEAQASRPEVQKVRPGWLGLRPGWMAQRGDGRMYVYTYIWKISPFYKTSSPLGAAAQKA